MVRRALRRGWLAGAVVMAATGVRPAMADEIAPAVTPAAAPSTGATVAPAAAPPAPAGEPITPPSAAPAPAAGAPGSADPAPPAPPVQKDEAPRRDADLDKPAEHRSGAVFGVALGGGLLDVTGSPNSASALDDPRLRHSSGVAPAFGRRFFLMGALADTFNFGVFVGGMSGSTPTTKVSSLVGGFRIEAFPLYSLAPRLRDLALTVELGVGSASADKKDGTLSVDGTESLVGAGVLYELARPSVIGLRAVPAVFAQMEHTRSASISSYGVMLGARIAFYGGP